MASVNRDLLNAAETGDLKAAEKCLENGADVHCRDFWDRTPLHKAAEGGYTNLAAFLISRSADIHRQDRNKLTPLHRALSKGHKDMAALLISMGADIKIQYDFVCIPHREDLLNAAYCGDLKAVETSLENGADVNCTDFSNRTLLHRAAEGGHIDLSALLISKGADIHNKDIGNQTPLHKAAGVGHIDLAALLISKGADIHSQDNINQTPLHIAAETDHIDLAALLISKGADIHGQDVRGRTALDIAEGETKILLKLVENGVDASHALEAAKHCDSLTEAQEYIQSPPLAAATVPINMPLDGDVQQPDQDIILPGIDDAKEFKSLLKLGTYESFGNRIYLGGACSVGKSTLASLLIGDEIPLEWKSTDGLKIFFGRNGIHLEEKKMVPLDKDKGNTTILSSVLRGHPDIDKSQPDKKQSQHDLEKNQPEESSSLSKLDNYGTNQQQPIPVSTDIESTQSKPTVAHSSIYDVDEKYHKMKMQKNEKPIQQRLGFSSIHEDIKQEIKKGVYKVKIAPSDLVDFGGQKSYDMTHQLFIQGKGTFTLLFDGRKGLHDPLPEYPQGNVTAALILKHWVDSILTYCAENDDDILPVILFVATHRDKLSEDKQKNMMIDIQQGLKEMFQNHERANRIKYNDIFFINGTDGSDAEVNRLQTNYVNIAFQQKSWGKRMPMACVPLELQLSEMRSSNVSIISKDDLIKINQENGDLALTNKELDDFLQVQHVLGKIMYVKDLGLENFIIVQPTSLVDILRSFITDEMFFPADTTLRKILNEMTKTGKIGKKDLFRLWEQDDFNKHMPDDNFKEFVLKVLIHLDFLVEPKRYSVRGNAGDVYLVPCIIKQEPATHFCESLEEEKTLYLSYKLVKSSIPSALSFKIIGSALNVWPLKENDDGGVCLYNKAAILRIDQSNELHILVRDNRVIVCLQNRVSKQFISPDIASCIQECLRLTIENALKFYHSSFGKVATKLEITKLFNIEVGEKCKDGICYVLLSKARELPSWRCSAGTEHETRFPLYWAFERIQKECHKDCKGPGADFLSLCPSEQHLSRLALYINCEIGKLREFVINLGLSDITWKEIELMYGRSDFQMFKVNFDVLCKWKMFVEEKLCDPSFEMLYEALKKTGEEKHLLCWIVREKTELFEIEHMALQKTPDDVCLLELSQKIGNCALHLGVELGLDTVQIEDTIWGHSKDMFKQNYDILTKWRNLGGNTTLRRLMQALQIVDTRGLTFLRKKYVR